MRKNYIAQVVSCCAGLILLGCGIGNTPTISAVAVPACSNQNCTITLTYNTQGVVLPLTSTVTMIPQYTGISTSNCTVNAVIGNQSCVITATYTSKQTSANGSAVFILGSGGNAVTSNSIPLSGS